MTIFTWLLTALSVYGVVLNIRKDHRCFYVWTFTNGSWAIVDAYTGIYAQSALFALYFVLAIWGLKKWKKPCVKEQVVYRFKW